jgi:hypothetical protein
MFLSILMMTLQSHGDFDNLVNILERIQPLTWRIMLAAFACLFKLFWTLSQPTFGEKVYSAVVEDKKVHDKFRMAFEPYMRSKDLELLDSLVKGKKVVTKEDLDKTMKDIVKEEDFLERLADVLMDVFVNRQGRLWGIIDSLVKKSNIDSGLLVEVESGDSTAAAEDLIALIEQMAVITHGPVSSFPPMAEGGQNADTSRSAEEEAEALFNLIEENAIISHNPEGFAHSAETLPDTTTQDDG